MFLIIEIYFVRESREGRGKRWYYLGMQAISDSVPRKNLVFEIRNKKLNPWKKIEILPFGGHKTNKSVLWVQDTNKPGIN